MGRRRFRIDEVLSFSIKPHSQATVRRYFEDWRKQQGLPERCDNSNCRFHSEPLLWNGASVKLVLDHVNGNNVDNRPENLRLLCPNCDSQLETRGGGNKGRIQNLSESGFEVAHRDGRRDAVVALKGVEAKLCGEPREAIINVVKKDA
jgi:hypothetical protein